MIGSQDLIREYHKNMQIPPQTHQIYQIQQIPTQIPQDEQILRRSPRNKKPRVHFAENS